MVLLAILLPLVSLDETARDLASRVHARLDNRQAVRVEVRNLSRAPAEARRSLERALARPGAEPAVEVRVTLSESLVGPLWVAEAAGQVFFARPVYPARTASRLSLQKKLLWEQENPILDLIPLDDGGFLVLGPDRITLHRPGATRSAPLSSSATRDPRGRLVVEGGRWRAHLPGVLCSGPANLDSAECRASEEPWLLGSWLQRGRNYFGGPKNVPPFFSATPFEDAWLLAGLDGQVRRFDPVTETAVPITSLNTDDLATLSGPCGSRVLAAQGGSVQAYEIADRQAAPSGEPVELPGLVTALWPLPGAALAVIRNDRTGQYAAYRVAMACGD